MKKGREIWKTLLVFILTISMFTGNLFFAEAAEEDSGKQEYSLLIPHTQTTGNINKFTFAEGRWNPGDSYHTWSLEPEKATPEKTYYEVSFYGHKIDIYAGKNQPMGMVKYTIDGVPVTTDTVTDGIFDLYNDYNINSTHIVTVDGLEEKEHIFRAEATGTANEKATGHLIDAAEVIVYHYGYEVSEIHTKKAAYALHTYQTVPLEYTLEPAYADYTGIIFTSDNEKVAIVSEEGVVEAVGAGTANITIASKAKPDVKKIVTITVTEAVVEMKGSIVDENLQWPQEKYSVIAEEKAPVMGKTLTGWKNDVVLSQISLASVNGKLTNLTVTASDFIETSDAASTSIIPKENISLHFLKSVQAYTGRAYGATPGYPVPEGDRAEANEVIYQDASVGIEVPYNHLQNVWVSVKIPKDVTAGTYEGTITAKADGMEEDLVFQYVIKVADAELPDAETFGKTGGFDIELWQNPFASAYYYQVEPFSKEHFEILTPIMEKYKSIGGYAVTTTIVDEAWGGQTYLGDEDIKFPTMVEWTRKIDGTWEFDYTKFDAWVEFNKKLGIGEKIVCYSIAPWTSSVMYYDELYGTREVQYLTTGTDIWREMWTAFLTELIAHLEEKGWMEETYIGIDERGFHPAAFDLIDSIVSKETGMSLKTAGAMDGFVDKPDLALRVDDLNVGSTAIKAHPAEFESIRQQRENLGLKTTMYTCTGHKPGNFSLSAPGESYWTMMYAASVQAEGYLRWAYDSWVENPLEDTSHRAFESGDCFLIFPDVKGTKNPKVYSSTRLEKMAQGVRDVNKLLIMKSYNQDLEREIDSLLETIEPVYESSQHYLTEYGKSQLAADMEQIETAIWDLTETYVDLKQAQEEQQKNFQKAKEGLTQAITEAEGKNVTDYTAETWEVFQGELQKAIAVLEKENVTTEELQQSRSSLQQAMANLVLVDSGEDHNQSGEGDNNTPPEEGEGDSNTPPEEGEGDNIPPEEGGGNNNTPPEEGNENQIEEEMKEYQEAKVALKASITIGTEKKQTDYTVESWQTYQIAYQEAKVLLEKENVTTEELRVAKQKLEIALQGLLLLPKQPETDNSEENQTPDGNQNLGGNQTSEGNQNLGGNQTPDGNENLGGSQTLNGNQNIGENQTPDESQDLEIPENYQPGTTFSDPKGIYQYKIKNDAEAIFTGVTKSISKVKIANTVTYKGKVLKVTSVSAKALYKDNVVTNIAVGANVTTIGKSAFEGCVKLKKISLGKKTKTIQAKALKGCKSLTKVTIPKTVITIGKQTFESCSKLGKITIKATNLKKVQKNAFKGIKATAKIKVSKKKLKAYGRLLKNKGQGTKVKIY